MRGVLSFVSALLLVCFSLSTAIAGPVIDRVKARGAVRCGGVERPGLAFPDGHGHWKGLEVDVCRAVAVAVLGAPDRIEFHAYENPEGFEAVRNQQDDIFFLTGSEIVRQNLAGKVLPGPTVFVESQNVMVSDKSAVRDVADLAGDSICYMIGSPEEQSLNACFAGLHKQFFHRAFSEYGEMVDTYQVQNCHALAGEITYLAATRLDHGVNHLTSRILSQALAAYPIMSATGLTDAKWSAIVAWTVDTLISAERPKTPWSNSGAQAMPVLAPELGLGKGWQERVVKALGTYAELFARNLGSQSALKLDRGLNANQVNGGLLLAPFVQ
ncbi:MAG: transporter substrate-binding domain-containing protein [Syntrophobacteraceae bacterium]|nr:transporter substrate-binding domain-containing protein [Syntrophobacteraceae bacterium]